MVVIMKSQAIRSLIHRWNNQVDGDKNMKTDLYTKTILTIIAICLVWICISMTTAAFASRDVIDVNIVKVSDKYIGPAVPVVQK